jgi:hypothetical protein
MSENTKNLRGFHWQLHSVPSNGDGTWSSEDIKTALLADIRDTLYEIRDSNRALVRIFGCANTQTGFRALRSIAATERAKLKKGKKK